MANEVGDVMPAAQEASDAKDGLDTVPSAVPGTRRRRGFTVGFLVAWGPGVVVMLADTDAGSLITAAQSGAL